MTKFKDLKSRKNNYTKRSPSVASSIAKVISTDPETESVKVSISPVKADILDVPHDKVYTLSIKEARNSDRQPNIKDLLGLKGGNSTQDMKVGEGSYLLLNNIRPQGDVLETTWANLAAGPKAIENDVKEPTVYSGMVCTRFYNQKGPDGAIVGRRWTTSVLNVSESVKVDSPADLSKALISVLDTMDEPGTPLAHVRVTENESGDPRSYFVSRSWDQEAGGHESAEAAVTRFMAANSLTDLEMDGVTVEVVPGRSLRVGGEIVKELTANYKDKMRLPSFRGTSKYGITEIHRNQRLVDPDTVSSRNSASEKITAFSSSLGQERDRKESPPPGADRSQGHHAAWIKENLLMFGYAKGDVLVRSRADKDSGEVYDFATVCAPATLTGIELEAIKTPHAPNHDNWLMRELQSSRDAVAAAKDDAVIEQNIAEDPGEELMHGAELEAMEGDDSPNPYAP